MFHRYTTTMPLLLSLDGYSEASLDADIRYTATPYDPGRTYGPPELCYPPEGGEVEVEDITVTINGARHTLPDWLVTALSAGLEDKLRDDAAERDEEARWEYAE